MTVTYEMLDVMGEAIDRLDALADLLLDVTTDPARQAIIDQAKAKLDAAKAALAESKQKMDDGDVAGADAKMKEAMRLTEEALALLKQLF